MGFGPSRFMNRKGIGLSGDSPTECSSFRHGSGDRLEAGCGSRGVVQMACVVSRRSLRRPTLAMIRDAVEESTLQGRNSFAPNSRPLLLPFRKRFP